MPRPGNKAIEVLLKARAFVVKRLGGQEQDGDAAAKGQYTWAKHGGAFKCWEVCKEICSLALIADRRILSSGHRKYSVYAAYARVTWGLEHFLKSEVQWFDHGKLSG